MSHNLSLRRALPALVALVLMVVALFPVAERLPVHGDERLYAWSSAYYTEKLLRLDLRTAGSDPYTDPAWAPVNFWTLTEPMGLRCIYGLAMTITGASPPSRPYSYAAGALNGPETEIPPETLMILRFTAVLCSVVGFMLIALKLGWRGTAAAAIVLAFPYSREDLSRAWAEGPLVLGFGLCVVAYGTRWFPIACGIAATLKLTALGIWPLTLFRRANGGRYGILGPPIAALAWTALTPPAWFLLGPFYLILMLVDRFVEFRSASQQWPGLFGLYFPTRYFLPFEFLFALTVVWIVPRIRYATRYHGSSRQIRFAESKEQRAAGPQAAESPEKSGIFASSD